MAVKYEKVLNSDLSFTLRTKCAPTKGNMAWEYNPFHNYRLSTNTTIDGNTYEAGELVDFDTDELKFSLNNPVDILPQYSYDNSVNLIINDGINLPRLINSRFTAVGKNTYEVVDRKGDNDTNIYDQGDQFDIDTSLYKRTIKIPKLIFDGVYSGGNLPVGNYHFYFKYCDADGNETDWIAESGLVSIFIGGTPQSINSGFENENSKKLVKFRLTNVDSAYNYIKVYYTREAAGIELEAKTTAYMLDEKFLIELNNICSITISGFVNPKTISTDEINMLYELVSSAYTQTSCKNMLFLANIHKPDIPYQELTDLALRFLPYPNYKLYGLEQTPQYDINSSNQGYYDPDFIYNFTGYWNDEIYRLGIVFIMPDNSLSPVFNIRGGYDLSENSAFSIFTDPPTDDSERKSFIGVSEDNYSLTGATVKGDVVLENAKGVITLKTKTSINSEKGFYIYGIKITTDSATISRLKKYTKGFFFVRLKRMPTTLCLAISIGTDKCNNTPTIPIGEANGLFASQLTGCNYTQQDTTSITKLLSTFGISKYNSITSNKTVNTKIRATGNIYIEESFMDTENRYLNSEFFTRVRPVSSTLVKVDAAICPEAEVDKNYYSNLFTGDDFKATYSDMLPPNNYFSWNTDEERNFYVDQSTYLNISELDRNKVYSIKALSIPDSSKTMAIGKHNYKGIIGNAVDGWNFDYIGYKNKVTKATNLIRGAWGPYLGITGISNSPLKQYDIKIPGYSTSKMSEYFKIRYNDNSGFYPISDRIDINNVNTEVGTFYRGDCYICQFTHRLNRNFQDPSAPNNDLIVDQKCWADNYSVSEGVMDKSKFTKINIGDLNASPLGMWVTFTVRSTKNLCIRGIDKSHSDEVSLVGHGRGFYPYFEQSTEGSYKIPEADCYNKAFQKEFGAKVNVEAADVPYIKNEFTNRILFSNPAVNDSFTNNYRVFTADHFKDFSKEYGQITKIVENNGSIICVFEHGVAEIPVNEKALLANAQGDNVYVGTNEVLGEPRIISDKFGSLWKDSIIKTPYYVYGVDTIAKKIWRVAAGTENLQCISDVHIQQFLNLNITLTEREITPVIGIRNVKTHYNAFKLDVMFTFYDNLYGFEEKVWNICWNEITQVWLTMYSWVPSYSENIYNQYFSFDRNVSKWITMLSLTDANSKWSEGIVVSNPIIDHNITSYPAKVGIVGIKDRNIPKGYTITYYIQHDNWGNWKYFTQDPATGGVLTESGNGYILTESGEKVGEEEWELVGDGQTAELLLYKEYTNTNCPVILLNIKAVVTKRGDSNTLFNEQLDKEGYYSNTIALCFDDIYNETSIKADYNKRLLTDFWKHGLAGNQDIADKIKPCFWYGKQHPFEFEFVVNDIPEAQKVFDNLQIISNAAEPESFHYEIVGDQLDFADDKKNMYIRLEAIKYFYQYNGSDILYDNNWLDLEDEITSNHTISTQNPRSTILPFIYESRDNTFNEIEDYYKSISCPNKNYDELTGSEITHDKVTDEYGIWTHQKAIDVDSEGGRLRGNMHYNRDNWYVQIRPIEFVLKNEYTFDNSFNATSTWSGDNKTDIPVTISNLPIPAQLDYTRMLIPSDLQGRIDMSNWGMLPIIQQQQSGNEYTYQFSNDSVQSITRLETKIRDKYIKIRIRYKGNKLAIIRKIITTYSQSL